MKFMTKLVDKFFGEDVVNPPLWKVLVWFSGSAFIGWIIGGLLFQLTIGIIHAF